MQRNPVKKRLQKFPRNTNPPLKWILGTFCTEYSACCIRHTRKQTPNSKADRNPTIASAPIALALQIPNPQSQSPPPLAPEQPRKTVPSLDLDAQIRYSSWPFDPLELSDWPRVFQRSGSLSCLWLGQFLCLYSWLFISITFPHYIPRNVAGCSFRIVRTGHQHTITSHSN